MAKNSCRNCKLAEFNDVMFNDVLTFRLHEEDEGCVFYNRTKDKTPAEVLADNLLADESPGSFKEDIYEAPIPGWKKYTKEDKWKQEK